MFPLITLTQFQVYRFEIYCYIIVISLDSTTLLVFTDTCIRLLRSVHWNLNHRNSNFRMTYGVWQDITINMKMVLNIYIHYSSEIKRNFFEISQDLLSLFFSSKCMHKLETNAYKSLIWMDWEITKSYIDGTKEKKRVLFVTFDMFQLGLPWFYQNNTF